MMLALQIYAGGAALWFLWSYLSAREEPLKEHIYFAALWPAVLVIEGGLVATVAVVTLTVILVGRFTKIEI